MEIAVLTAFLTPFLPFLMKLGEKASEKAAEKFGEDAWNKAKAIWAKLHPQIEKQEAVKVAAEQVAAKPESDARKAVFQEELEVLMAENPALIEAIAQIFKQDAPDGTSGTQIIQNVTGTKNQVIGQVFGGKVIGNVEGNATL